MSFQDFKEVNVNNPGTSAFYGADDLSQIMQIFNGKVVTGRQIRIKNPWQFIDQYQVKAISVVPGTPPANTKAFYVDPSDTHFKMKDPAGAVLDFDVLGAGAQGEANLGANVGTAGVGPFKTKSGVTLQFYKIAAASNKLSVALNSGADQVDLNVVEANLLHQNIGGILPVTKGGTGVATLLSNALLRGAGTGNIATIVPGTDGHIMTMVAGAPAWAASSASADVKTAVFEAGTQIGTVGRRLNFSVGDDFTITENTVNDRFDISQIRSEALVARWENDNSGSSTASAKTNAGSTYIDVFTANGDGHGLDVDGSGKNDFRFYVSWDKNGGSGTHSCRVVAQGSSDVLAEIVGCVNGRNVITGTIPAFFQDNVRSIKVQMKSTISTDDPRLRGAAVYYK